MLRTHTCGELNASHADQTVTICGWVDSIRDLGGSKFVLVRDRYGSTQVVINPSSDDSVQENVKKLHNECVFCQKRLLASRVLFLGQWFNGRFIFQSAVVRRKKYS